MDINYIKARCTVLDTGCWHWNGAKNPKGYGRMTYKQVGYYPHRLVYQLTHGELEHGKHICHTCDNPSCCNPEHLFQGTPKENERDKISKARNVAGTSSHFAKLDVVQIEKILQLKGTNSQKNIGKLFGVSQQTVGRIWGNVTYLRERPLVQ